MRRILVVITLVLAMGLHWGVLQTVAWTTMVVGFAKDRSLDEAISMTFGGQHPCGLCSAIRDAREGRPDAPAPSIERHELPKAVLPTLPPALPWTAPIAGKHALRDAFALSGRHPKPPLPPPRLS